MALELLKERLANKLDEINRYKNNLDIYFGVVLINKDTDKIGFFVSSFIHLLLITIAIGIPSCFQPKTINVPNIIPIEILNIDEITNIPLNPVEKIEKKEKEIKKSKQVKFASNNQTEIEKIQDIKDEIKDTTQVNKDIPKKQEMIEKIPKKPEIEEKKIEEKIEFESLPTKKIKPKIKPKPKVKEQEDTDVIVEIKSKPAPKKIFNISSVLKDLRNENIQTNIQDSEKRDKDNSESSENEKEQNSNEFTISEIDLLKQQLYACWAVPAGAKGASDMVVKVRVWVNPDRTVSNARILDTNLMQSNPYFRTVAESALRAVLNPACSPLKLPPEKYDVWKKFIFKFELGWMLGNE